MKFEFKKIEIPQPTETEDKGGGYIKWGKDNLYPQYLNSLLKGSSDHSSILYNQVQRIVGSGFQSEDPIQRDIIEGMKLNEWLYNAAFNLVLYGGFSTDVIWGKFDKKVLQIESVPLDRIRVGFVEEDLETPSLYFYSTEYHKYKYGGRIQGMDVIGKWNPKLNKPDHQLYYDFGLNRVGNDIYPVPDYISGVHWIETSIKIPQYYLNLISRNFMVSQIIVVPDLPSEEEREKFERNLKNNFTDVENAGSTLVVYSNSPEQEVKVHNISGEQGERKYDELLIMTIESISRTWRLPSPILAGISLPGNLFGITDLPGIERLYNKSVIYPKRQQLLNHFNELNDWFKTPLTDFTIEDDNIFDEKTT